MKRHIMFPVLATLLFLLIFGTSAEATHLAVPIDTKLHFLINNTEVSSMEATTATGAMDITTPSPIPIGGGVTVTIAPVSTTVTGCVGMTGRACIEWSEANETLWMKNAKITFSAPVTDVSFTFWRKFNDDPPTGPTGSVNVGYEARGAGFLKRGVNQAAQYAKLRFLGYYEHPAGTGTNTVIGGLSDSSVPCGTDTLVKCPPNIMFNSSVFSWANFVQAPTTPVAVSSERVLTGKFWLTTIMTSDNLVLPADNATVGLRVMETTAAGGGETECSNCKGTQCVMCYATECPSCPTAPITVWHLIIIVVVFLIALVVCCWRRRAPGMKS